ncbi:MAG: TIM barrel protein [Verrucomicrobiota bacterium]
MHTRRSFLRDSSAFLAASALGSLTAKAGPAPLEVSLFTKHLLGLSYDRLGEALAEIGVKAIEAPVRAGGHVEPAKVEEDLPKLVETLRKYGVTITMLTSGINSVSEATHTEKVLRTAQKQGIKKYRMNWYTYDNRKPIWPQLDEVRPRLKDLVALSKEIGILPCYQNHSGAKLVGAGIWDMAFLMRDYRPDELAWCFDIMHATIEGGMSWPTEVRLVSDQMGMAFFKNFVWEGKKHRSVPLGEGAVDKSYVTQLKSLGYSGPVCLHVEYLKPGVTDPVDLAKAIAATRADLTTLQSWWA